MDSTAVPEKSDHIRKGPWTQDEDRRLTSYIQSHGARCWPSVPKAAGLHRSIKSCRLRWINYLNPATKRGNFTDGEEELIISLHRRLGNRWSFIANRLPGRTDNEVRNYWNSHISKKLKEMGADPLTHRPMNHHRISKKLNTSESSSTGKKEEETKMKTRDDPTSTDEGFSDGSRIFCQESSVDSTNMKTPDKSTINDEAFSDYSDIFWRQLFSDGVAEEPHGFPIFDPSTYEDTPGFTMTTNGTTIPPQLTHSPIPEDSQNANKNVLQLDYSDSEATQNEMIAAVEESNANDTDVEQNNTSTCVTSSLDKTCISETPDEDYITTKIRISLEVLKQHFGMNMEDAAKSLRVSRSSLKRMCRENGIESWPRPKKKKINRQQLSNVKKVNKLVRDNDEQTTESTRRESSPPKEVAVVTPLGDASSSSSVTVKATCGDDIIKFPLSLSSGMDDLREKVAKRLDLEVGSFKLKHKDDAGDLVLINCDEDLQDCLGKLSRSVGKSTLDMLVLPITNQSVLHTPLLV